MVPARFGLVALFLGFLPAQAAAQEIVITVGEEWTVSVDPGSQFSVPVIVDMSEAAGLDLASLELRLRWDAGRLSLVDAEPGSFGDVQTEQAPGGGELSASLSSTAGATSTFTLLTLTFEASAEEGPTPVVVEPLAAADGAGQTILGSVRRRILGACLGEPGLLGDVTGDRSVNIIDAQQMARFVVGLGVVDCGVLERMAAGGWDHQV